MDREAYEKSAWQAFGAEFRKFRRRYGVPATAVAKALCRSEGYVFAFERGDVRLLKSRDLRDALNALPVEDYERQKVECLHAAAVEAAGAGPGPPVRSGRPRAEGRRRRRRLDS